MKATTRFAAPLLAIALGAVPALSMSAQQYGGPPPPPQQQGYNGQQPGYDRGPGQGPWDHVPDEYSEVSRHGFHDGIEAARMDFESHRQLDPHRAMMYRRPPVPRFQRDEYRHSFEHGYMVSMHHHMDHMGEGPGPNGPGPGGYNR